MLIRQQIVDLVNSGELFCLESLMFGHCTPRTLFVTREVLDAVTFPYPERCAELHAEFRQDLDSFLEGGEITIGLNPDAKDWQASMARVKPVEDEFFDFRVTSPYPYIRAFGGFSEFDTFVIVTWQYRDVIDNDFDAEVRRCKHEWQKLFGRIPPFSGSNINDYLSNYLPV